jgi:hypothetical protein
LTILNCHFLSGDVEAEIYVGSGGERPMPHALRPLQKTCVREFQQFRCHDKADLHDRVKGFEKLSLKSRLRS